MPNNGNSNGLPHGVSEVLSSQSMGVYQLKKQIEDGLGPLAPRAYVLLDPIKDVAYYLTVSQLDGVRAARARVLGDKWKPDTRPIVSLDELKEELAELGFDVPSIRQFDTH